MSILEIQDVVVQYKRAGRLPVRAVCGASLTLERGQIVGLVGETGCGKSSLARAAAGLVAPLSGIVMFDGKPLRPLSRRARDREQARVQMVFQNPFSSLNPRRRVGEQVADAMSILNIVPRKERAARVAQLLELVGLSSNAASRFPHEYSGGQRQRIAIARALAADPSVIVLDEPLSALDASAQAQVANLLRDLADELKVGLLLISHDLAIVHQVADIVAVMYLGEIVESGVTDSLWSKPMHPYTEALLDALPRIESRGHLPAFLPSEVPDPAQPPSGCRFHPRCRYAFEKCPVDTPPTIESVAGRRVACWLHDEGSAERSPATLKGGTSRVSAQE